MTELKQTIAGMRDQPAAAAGWPVVQLIRLKRAASSAPFVASPGE
jgi:hypothetical protein